MEESKEHLPGLDLTMKAGGNPDIECLTQVKTT
jgi:hypothetical protein